MMEVAEMMATTRGHDRASWRLYHEDGAAHARRLDEEAARSREVLEHKLGITVSDFNKAVKFYSEVFGCPVVGDPVYGRNDVEPLMLYARSITLPICSAR